jgi:hypothetical protein
MLFSKLDACIFGGLYRADFTDATEVQIVRQGAIRLGTSGELLQNSTWFTGRMGPGCFASGRSQKYRLFSNQ